MHALVIFCAHFLLYSQINLVNSCYHRAINQDDNNKYGDSSDFYKEQNIVRDKNNHIDSNEDINKKISSFSNTFSEEKDSPELSHSTKYDSESNFNSAGRDIDDKN